MEATKEQIKAINTILSKKGLMDQKANIIGGATHGRTEHSSELLHDEAHGLLIALNKITTTPKPSKKMFGKMVAIAHEMGWITEQTVVTASGMQKKNNYNDLNNWVLKYGYLKKKLNDYTYAEFPKLLTQFEMGPYKSFLKKST